MLYIMNAGCCRLTPVNLAGSSIVQPSDEYLQFVALRCASSLSQPTTTKSEHAARTVSSRQQQWANQCWTVAAVAALAICMWTY
jgi:hypothetical protein